jgi:hypothetical protein
VVSIYGIRERTRVIPLGIDGEWLEPVDERTMQARCCGKLEAGYFLFTSRCSLARTWALLVHTKPCRGNSSKRRSL